MPSRYKIAFFIRHNGECPVEDYLFASTNEKDFEVLISAMQTLAQVGQALLDTNMAKDLTGYKPICELVKDRHRIFYAEDKATNRFIMLSAFLKRTNSTPVKELELAKTYWNEYQKNKSAKDLDIPLDYDLANL